MDIVSYPRKEQKYRLGQKKPPPKGYFHRIEVFEVLNRIKTLKYLQLSNKVPVHKLTSQGFSHIIILIDSNHKNKNGHRVNWVQIR